MNHQYLWICPRKLINPKIPVEKNMWQQGKQIRALDLICFLNDELHELETALKKFILSRLEQRNDCIPKRTLKQNIQAMWTRCKHVQTNRYIHTRTLTIKQVQSRNVWKKRNYSNISVVVIACHWHSPKSSKLQWDDTLWLVAPLALANGCSLDL